MRFEIKVIVAGLVMAMGIPAEALARGRGGFAAGGRSAAVVGNRGAAAGGHTFVGPNGGSIQHGAAGGVTRGPLGGVHAAGVQGTQITTPGGKTINSVSSGRANVGPFGGASVSGGRATGVSGPGGSAVIGHRGGGAVGPYGGVAAGGTRFAAGNSTHYMSGAAIRTQAVAVRGGYDHGAFTAGWYGRYPAAWRPGRWVGPNYWITPVWTSVAAFCALTGPPITYDYGSNVVIENNNVYRGWPKARSRERVSDTRSTIPSTTMVGAQWRPGNSTTNSPKPNSMPFRGFNRPVTFSPAHGG